MKITKYPEIDIFLQVLLSKMQIVLGTDLEALYLYGSLVWGDFDLDISDIDLLAVTKKDINKKDFTKLDEMHSALVKEFPKWNDRIEIAYITKEALQTFKVKRSPLAIISPGEPFNIKDAGNDWLINWYIVLNKGVTIYGLPPKDVIADISKSEFLDAVKKQALEWREYVSRTKHSRPYQGYAILTMCRALYSYRNGEQVSKQKAAQWAIKELPKWSNLIQKALSWRIDYKNKDIDHEKTYEETEKFVRYVAGLISKE